MSDTTPPPAPLSPSDALPPVEPPSAGFIVQLFVIPAVIVAIIIIVWATFNWLAHMGNDPRAYVEALKRNNEGRWQVANDLANELNRNEGLQKDEVILRELSQLLANEVEGARMDQSAVDLRAYLCLAIGSFRLPEAVEPLLTALKTNRDPGERDVRLAALQGLTKLLPNLAQFKPQENAELRKQLLASADDADPVVRYHAAHTLAALGDAESLRKVEVMLHDGNVDVRMNAALAAAPHGIAACVPELAKMLDPAETEGLLTELDEKNRDRKRSDMFVGALNASRRFAEKNPSADVKPLVAGIDKLLASNPPTALKLAAEDVKRDLQKGGG